MGAPVEAVASEQAEPRSDLRIGVAIVAYNAATTLTAVLDRLPASFRTRVEEIVVCDDASQDNTYEVGLAYREQSDLPLTILRRPRNLGYGGNQKEAYRWAMESNLDVVVMLHGDGQYAPEVIEDIIRPFEISDCDAVFGSRMMDGKSAREGGMPLYKFVGNRILSVFSNAVTGLKLTEWHSGYRAYRVSALRDIPLERNSDGFDFDTEIILQLLEANKTITEVSIPTFYGDEICYVNGMGYAKDVVADVLRYRAHKMGIGTGEMAFNDDSYRLKMSQSPSHLQLLEWVGDSRPATILDVGCSDGRFGALLRLKGHTVIGVDSEKIDGVADRLDGFYEANLDQGLPAIDEGPFDLVIGADVLEHTVNPALLLKDMGRVLSPRGIIMLTVPNLAHWYPRARITAGSFDYENRGIFDARHVRFFTRKSLNRLISKNGFSIRREATVGMPLDVTERGGPKPSRISRTVGVIERTGLKMAPNLFGYQLVVELEPTR